MLQAGKMEEIADELKKYNIQITALQEVRWPHNGWIKKKNYTQLYSGSKTSMRQHGTGFLLQVEWHNAYYILNPLMTECAN